MQGALTIRTSWASHRTLHHEARDACESNLHVGLWKRRMFDRYATGRLPPTGWLRRLIKLA